MVSLNPQIIIDIGMAIGPIVGYISQYSLIKNIKSIGSFSIDICGILLFANILRLNFYVFQRFSTALVFQSLFMITMQIILVHECSKYMHKKQGDEHSAGTQQVQITLKDNEEENDKVQSFWRWTGFEKYGVCILFFTFCTSVLTLMFYWKQGSISSPSQSYASMKMFSYQYYLFLPHFYVLQNKVDDHLTQVFLNKRDQRISSWSPISSPYGSFIGLLALTSQVIMLPLNRVG